ncbi:MAG: sulfatase [Verrucomicrobiae bacterium]|nr:sulfatase [Verrucomicrobiae bacterium]
MLALVPISRGDESRPNLLFILADDLGWSDLGCYGNEYFETPHLDQFASQGLRFTRAYSPAPICSASRAALLTGKSPARLGFEFVTKPEAVYQPLNEPLRAPPFTLDLPLEEITIAEAVSAVGYETAFFGKWHLNRHYQRYLGWSPTHGPKAQGFQVAEEDFGSHPYSYWNDKSERTFLNLPDGKFPIDSMTQRAVDFLKKPHEKPFFLMVSHFYVHAPVHSRIKWLHDRYARAIPAEHPRHDDLAHYGSMVTTLDHLVGELLTALDAAGLTDSTLVVFTSDNGGHPEYAGNAPLRGSKWNLYEGGIRVPFLARWPGRIPTGGIVEAPVIGTDMFPTFAELAGAPLPSHLDGTSLVSRLLDPETPAETRKLIWHFPYYHPEAGFSNAPPKIGIDDGITSQTRPHSVIQSDGWKLIHFYENSVDELFHLPSDLSEQIDRSQAEPVRAKRLHQELESVLSESNARLPIPNPDFPRKK